MEIETITDHTKPLEVRPSEFKTFEAAVKKFRKLVEKDGKLRKVRERARGFVKPSKRKHDKKRFAKHMRQYQK